MTEHDNLAKYVRPELTDARLERQWSRVAGVRPRRLVGARALLAVGALGAVALAAGVAVRGPWRGAPASLAGTIVETGDTASEVLTLPDGSSVRPERATRVEIVAAHARGVHLRLARGSAAFDVTHRAERSFVVSTPDVDIKVRGTRFRVTVGEADRKGDVIVAVTEGAVEVCPALERACHIVDAGETFSTRASVREEVRDEAASGVSRVVPAERPAAPQSVPPAAEAPARGKTRATYAALGRADFAEALVTASPEALFELADEARLAGAPRDAAQAFDRLRRRYRTDPRAGLAAFQLGRLRLDMGDAASAAEALTDALALARRAPFREDAEARLVEAWDAAGPGAAARCTAAREVYLRDYPSGVHAPTVSRRCAEK